jgi:hypothetical protein
MSVNDSFGVNPDKRKEVNVGLRRDGVTGGKSIKDKFLNQLFFELRQNHLWGTAAQVALDDATFYSDSAGLIYDKNAVDITATLQDDDVIVMIHDDTQATDLKIQPTTSKRLKIKMGKGAEIDFGDAGAGVPYKFEVGSNIKKGSEISLRGSFDFGENALSIADRRIVNNRAHGVKIKYNEDVIFDPQHSGEFVDLNTAADNPYLIEHDGQQLDWLDDASNTAKTLFRDLNRKTGGLLFNGTAYDEARSRFSVSAIAAYRFQVGAGYGFRRQISADNPDIHAQTDINGVSVAGTASFVNGSPVVTYVDITDIKNGHRISGADAQGIPDVTGSISAVGTTILKDIDTTAKTATMIDALTKADVNATATIGSIATVMDNSGAAGGGQQEDVSQGHTHNMGIAATNGTVNLSATNYLAWDDSVGNKNGTVTASSIFNTTIIGASASDGINGTTRISSQNYPISTGIITYQKA